MIGLPTHELFLITKDGKSESFEMADFSSKKEVRNEVKSLVNSFKDRIDMSIYVKFAYTDSNRKVIYSDTIDKCFE